MYSGNDLSCNPKLVALFSDDKIFIDKPILGLEKCFQPLFIIIHKYIKPVYGALHDPWPFCDFESRLIYGYHAEEHKTLHQIPNKNDLFKAKQSYGR